MTWKSPRGSVPEQPNLLSKTFAATVGLLMIARRIMDLVNGLSSCKKRDFTYDELVSDIDVALNSWKSNLSPDVDLTPKSRSTATPHRLMLHLCYWWLTILIHRPFYHRTAKQVHSSDKQIDHIKLCKQASQNIMELAETWRDLYTLRYVPVTFIQTIFSAGTVYLLQAVQATQGIRVAEKELRHGHEQATRCIQYLLEVGKSFQAATNIADILKGLIRKQVNPSLERGQRSRRRRKISSAKESRASTAANNSSDDYVPADTLNHSQFDNTPHPTGAEVYLSPPALTSHSSGSSSSFNFSNTPSSSMHNFPTAYPSPSDDGSNAAPEASYTSIFSQEQQSIPIQSQVLVAPAAINHYDYNRNTSTEFSSVVEEGFWKVPCMPMEDTDIFGLNMSSSSYMGAPEDLADVHMIFGGAPQNGGGMNWGYAPAEPNDTQPGSSLFEM